MPAQPEGDATPTRETEGVGADRPAGPALDPRSPVPEPRTGNPTHVLAAPTHAALTALCGRLRTAQPRWELLSAEGRGEVLRRFADRLERHREPLVAALSADTGRTVESRLELDITGAALRRWADEAPALLRPGAERDSAIPWVGIRTGDRPYQLAGVISPWNFPLLLSLIDTIPALAAGCAVVVKPSEVTPRFVDVLNEAVAEDPELSRVLAFVEGGGGTGEALVGEVDIIAFTGSVPTGRRVAHHAAERLIPACLELGGKDPAIVCADADLDHAASAILWGGTANAGQSCLSIERVYVHRDRFAEFTALLVAKAERVGLAYPDPSAAGLGPIIDRAQVQVIDDHLRDAYARGATALTGGTLEHLGGGTYLRPTVLTDVDHTMKVMTEETFGPVLPVMAFDTLDEAVALAEDSPYGLSAAVFAGQANSAAELGRRLSAGAVSVNDAALTAVLHEGEKNAFKQSGLGGSRMGPASIQRFLRRQSLLIHRGAVEDPWWHPA